MSMGQSIGKRKDATIKRFRVAAITKQTGYILQLSGQHANDSDEGNMKGMVNMTSTSVRSGIQRWTCARSAEYVCQLSMSPVSETAWANGGRVVL